MSEAPLDLEKLRGTDVECASEIYRWSHAEDSRTADPKMLWFIIGVLCMRMLRR